MLNSEKILILEDDPDSLAFITNVLSEAGFITCSASNSLDAIRLTKEILPNLVLLDQSLPDLDEKEVCDKIRSLDGKASVLYLVTPGVTEELSRLKGIVGGVDDFLVKPFSKELLLARVNALLRMRRLEEAQRVNDERVNEIIENLPVGFQSLDKNGLLKDVNTAWITMLGYKKEEVLGKSFRDFILPGSLEAFHHWFDQVKAGQKVQKTEIELSGKTGEIKRVSLECIVASGTGTGSNQIDCTLTNLPQANGSQQFRESLLDDSARYQEALDQVASFIFMKDKNHRYTYANKMIQKLF
nr:PAS domain S-box protein [Anaerolineaceae bacterium]